MGGGNIVLYFYTLTLLYLQFYTFILLLHYFPTFPSGVGESRVNSGNYQKLRSLEHTCFECSTIRFEQQQQLSITGQAIQFTIT